MMLLLTHIACNPTEITPNGVRSSVIVNNGSLDNKAFVYRESPAILAGENYGPAVEMTRFLDRANPQFITPYTVLEGDCSLSFPQIFMPVTVGKCLESKSSRNPAEMKLVRNEDRSWVFPVGTKEFYQVNALYHLQHATNKFLDKLRYAYSTLNQIPDTAPKAIPKYLASSGMFWFKALSNQNNQLFKNTTLTSYSQCNINKNASFSPAGPELCFGYDSDHPSFFVIQDPSVVYHELGHAFVSIMMNLRNGISATNHHDFRSNLGSYGYDEAGSINEGLSDYFSYVMNGRTHIGEWALGRNSRQSRPMSERDKLHISGIAATPEGRLAYPQYLLYDPNNPTKPIENVHQAGQIVSHYLVALTESLQEDCSFGNEEGGQEAATSMVMMLVAESLGEIGDLNARGGIDNLYGPQLNNFYNNLDKDASFLWTHVVNQTTYRRFFQIFAKNINKYLSRRLCTGFDKNKSEKLLDDYGLLLFRNYNDNGTSTKRNPSTNMPTVIPGQILTRVAEENVRKSVLVSKQLLNLASDVDAKHVGFYIIDGRTEIENLLKDLLFKGFPVPISKGVASVEYNNNNIKISPGEIVAIIPNMYNSSNSTMAGIQLLASDWDHMDLPDTIDPNDANSTILDTASGHYKPCEFDANSPVNVDQGAVRGRTCSNVQSSYRRSVPVNNQFPAEAAAPICLVLQEEGKSTKWVSQNEFRKKQGLSLLPKDCLGFSASGSQVDSDFTFNPNECLVRFLPGVNEAFFSRIEPRKTYFDSVVKLSEKKEFNSGNLMIMEVSKWIPPGTKFLCRMRARFSNCSDCYTDPQDASLMGGDYLDSDYNGHKPFKVINFEFDVND